MGVAWVWPTVFSKKKSCSHSGLLHGYWQFLIAVLQSRAVLQAVTPVPVPRKAHIGVTILVLAQVLVLMSL